MKPEMHDGWGMHDPRQEGTGDREAYLSTLSAMASSWISTTKSDHAQVASRLLPTMAYYSLL